jgi:hypothetical protein
MVPYRMRPNEVTGKAVAAILSLGLLVCAAGTGWAASAGDGPVGESKPVWVSVDIRPGLCPNHLRVQSPLTVPIAIMGTMSFEIGQVDPVTVRISREGTAVEIEPAGFAYADVGTPLVGGLCACHNLRGDGIDDLEFYFPIRDVVAALGLEEHSGEMIELSLTGKLMTGEAIRGVDCAVVLSGPWDDENLGREVCMLTWTGEGSDAGEFKFAYSTAVSDRVTFAIHDVSGRVVAELANMDMAPGIYTAIWDGTCLDSRKAPAGVYFARVSNSLASDMKKIIMPQ